MKIEKHELFFRFFLFINLILYISLFLLIDNVSAFKIPEDSFENDDIFETAPPEKFKNNLDPIIDNNDFDFDSGEYEQKYNTIDFELSSEEKQIIKDFDTIIYNDSSIEWFYDLDYAYYFDDKGSMVSDISQPTYIVPYSPGDDLTGGDGTLRHLLFTQLGVTKTSLNQDILSWKGWVLFDARKGNLHNIINIPSNTAVRNSVNSVIGFTKKGTDMKWWNGFVNKSDLQVNHKIDGFYSLKVEEGIIMDNIIANNGCYTPMYFNSIYNFDNANYSQFVYGKYSTFGCKVVDGFLQNCALSAVNYNFKSGLNDIPLYHFVGTVSGDKWLSYGLINTNSYINSSWDGGTSEPGGGTDPDPNPDLGLWDTLIAWCNEFFTNMSNAFTTYIIDPIVKFFQPVTDNLVLFFNEFDITNKNGFVNNWFVPKKTISFYVNSVIDTFNIKYKSINTFFNAIGNIFNNSRVTYNNSAEHISIDMTGFNNAISGKDISSFAPSDYLVVIDWSLFSNEITFLKRFTSLVMIYFTSIKIIDILRGAFK